MNFVNKIKSVFKKDEGSDEIVRTKAFDQPEDGDDIIRKEYGSYDLSKLPGSKSKSKSKSKKSKSRSKSKSQTGGKRSRTRRRRNRRKNRRTRRRRRR